MRSVLAVRHVGFEDLGAFAAPLRHRGFDLHYVEAGDTDFDGLNMQTPDLVIVLGGPIGVYEAKAYPFLSAEIEAVRRRLAGGKPMIGICLGAQLVAAAADARVYPSGVKEIGFAPITLTDAGRASPLAPFAAAPITLHWHGDTFDLPEGAALLASTDLVAHQAFSIGARVLGCQFHPEAGGAGFEHWLIGHAAELASAKIDVAALRADNARYGAALARQAEAVLDNYLEHAGL
jgi:GMP synthase (glutamine-hydrolysing)